MDRSPENAMTMMMTRISTWIKSLFEESATVGTPEALTALEQPVREEGQALLGATLETLVQNAVDHQTVERACPDFGRRRRHKGRRGRGLLSSVGALQVQGTYWYCQHCGGQHALDTLAPDRFSHPMQELLCLLGTALASFAKASTAAQKLLGVRVSDATIRRLCHHHGAQDDSKPVTVEPDSKVVGSCDGTMVHTRQEGWKELRAYQFRYDAVRHGRAYLEAAGTFTPRLRQAAGACCAACVRYAIPRPPGTPRTWTIPTTSPKATRSPAARWRVSASNWASVSRAPACAGVAPTSSPWRPW